MLLEEILCREMLERALELDGQRIGGEWDL